MSSGARHPPLGRLQGGGFDPAGTHAPDLLRQDEAARLEDVEVLQTAGSDIASGAASVLTEAGPWVRRSTIIRRVGSARAWTGVEHRRLVKHGLEYRPRTGSVRSILGRASD